MQEPSFWDSYKREQSFGAVFITQYYFYEDIMHTGFKKYVILIYSILVLSILCFFGISYIKSIQMIQPEGETLSVDEFLFLQNEILGEYSSDIIGIDVKNEQLKYSDFCLWAELVIKKMDISISDEEKENYHFKHTYKNEFFVLKEDVIAYLLYLSSIIDVEHPYEMKNITMICRKEKVKVSDFAKDEVSRQHTIFTKDKAFYELNLYDQKFQSELLEKGLCDLECIANDSRIVYIFNRTDANITFSNCFVIRNQDEITFCWDNICITLPGFQDYKRMDDIVDISCKDGRIDSVQIYQDKVHGKLLCFDKEHIELLCDDKTEVSYQLNDQFIIYNIFDYGNNNDDQDSVNMPNIANELAIGYDFTDFVLNEKQEVIAGLITRNEQMDNIRVLIKNNQFESYYHDEIILSCDTDFKVIDNACEKDFMKDQSISITGDSELFEGNRLFIKPSALTSRISILSLERSQGIPQYRGTLEIVKTQEGLLCVNEVLLEEYLYSVVPSEMPSSYPEEALKAQAVSARTYAYGHMQKGTLGKYGAHVDDSTSFQVYNNINEMGTTTEAVKATNGEVAMKNSQLIETYFYSTSCGFGSDISVWHTNSDKDYSYLTSKQMSGEETLDPKKMMEEDNFRAYISDIHGNDFEAEETWYRWKYHSEFDQEILMEQFMQKYGQHPEQILTMTEDGSFLSEPISDIGELIDIKVNKRLSGGIIDELDFVGTKKTIRVISEINIRAVLVNKGDTLTRLNGENSPVTTLLPSAFCVIDVTKDKKGHIIDFDVIGGGYGHGIGLSQNGAKNMAESGYIYQDIMKFFYKGIEIQNMNNL